MSPHKVPADSRVDPPKWHGTVELTPLKGGTVLELRNENFEM